MIHWKKLAIAATALAAAGAAIGASQQSLAAPITVNFTGTVASASAGVASAFGAGDALTGSYTFESTTAARVGSNSTQAVFDALSAFSFAIGSYSATSGGASEIQIDNADGVGVLTDRYALVSLAGGGLTGPDVNGNALGAFGFRLDDSTGAIFSDALLLPASVSLADFDLMGFFIFFGTELVSGTITGITFTGVPEPAMLALFGAAALGAGLMVRRRRA